MPHAGASSKFVHHQVCSISVDVRLITQKDVEYVEGPREDIPPYVSVWCSLDEVDEVIHTPSFSFSLDTPMQSYYKGKWNALYVSLSKNS